MAQQPQPIPETRLAESELARRDGNRVTVRPSPTRLRFDLPDLITADGHRLHLTFDCAVLARPEPAERQMLAEAFLSNTPSCSAADVARAFTPPVSAAARQAVSAKPAADCLTDAAKPAFVESLRRAVDAAGFTTGLEVVPPYSLHVESPSVQRMDQDRAAREQAEREQADRLAHLRRAAEVVKEFESIRQSSPDLPLPVVLSRLAASDQTRVVQSLLESGPRETAPLYAVAGPHLLRISTTDLATEEIPLPSTVGPFRSVQQIDLNGQPRLAIGARGGVILLDPDSPATAEPYLAPDVTSAMGFNRVVLFNGRLYASHSEIGIVTWNLHDHAQPSATILTDGARNLQVLADRLLYTAGSRVTSIDEAPSPSSGEPIVALLPTPRNLLAIHPTGDIEQLDRQTLRPVKRDRRSPRVSAATLLPFYDTPRLLLATEDGPITCLSPDDSAVTQYASPHRGLRALAATPGTIAGISADRQRLVLIDTSSHAVREVYAAARLRHRVGDLTFAR